MTEKLCDRAHEGGAQVAAAYDYTWAWGEQGSCCQEHRFLLEQTATQLERQIQFTPLGALTTPPVERAERINFNARILSLEAEVLELQSAGATTYSELQSARSDCRLAVLGKAEAERQNKALVSANRELQVAVEAEGKRAAALEGELAMLRPLVSAGGDERLTALGDELQKVQNQLLDTATAADELKRQLERRNGELNNALEDNAAAKAALGELQNRATDLERELAARPNVVEG